MGKYEVGEICSSSVFVVIGFNKIFSKSSWSPMEDDSANA